MNTAMFDRNRPIRFLFRLALGLLLAAVLPVMPGLAAITCKPLLTVKNVRESRPDRMSQPWVWTATVVANGKFCATSSGAFEIDFIRIKEYAPDMQFTQKYTWTSGQFDLSMELAVDEAIHDYRIGFISPCVCRELPYK